MKLNKQLTGLCLCAAMLAGCTSSAAVSATASAEASAGSKKDPDVAAIILFTNDVHGRIINDTDEPSWGYARIAKEKQDLVEAGYDTYLFSAGDDTQGEPIVNQDEGASAIKYMTETGYDLMEAGNHEFDWGSDNLLKIKEDAGFPILAANITRTSDGTLLLDANHIFTTSSGMKIGVFGLDTPTTMTGTNPDHIAGLTFAQGDDLYQCAQDQIDELKNENCDLIICLGHLGVNQSSAPNRSIDVIENTTGIDVFIDGHSHSEVNEMVNDTLLVQTGCYGHNLGKLTVNQDHSVSAELIPAVNQNETVAQDINDYETEIEKELGTTIGTSTVDLDGVKADVRSMETNLGDFVCDAVMYEVQNNTSKHVDAAIMNGGGIRDSISAGDISMLTLKSVFPFGNVIVTVDVTGAELLEALEAATFSTPEVLGAFPQVSGIVYTVDTTVEYAQGEQYPSSTYYKPADPGSRVTITSVGGNDFDLNATYTIASNDFIGAGGDTYYAFKYAYDTAGFNTGIPLEDALSDYLTNGLGGVIDETYAAPQGRITIKQ
ncbi:MAG: bifunctional metallophosphatase/5'-nucleotidase [Solobacterium sp.]|jgi:2',3'-cyclic-nucleotide 2'-phosphodiesterase (5'-nucleotidase family)|nr:bifunctional metallophosphatase/5'-nucleotidase [Solobacterium sp.]MCH4222413.1 bifunctional metallophosphatase/5'-nucleotidase [Solobacterium sp.]MCH4265950.1 bifunctional metallophosphatase/5'-nucleotidase [Solobacterium sp.]